MIAKYDPIAKIATEEGKILRFNKSLLSHINCLSLKISLIESHFYQKVKFWFVFQQSYALT